MTSRRVLVVEDDEDIAYLLSLLLTREGYDVATAQNGAVALERLAERAPDVILLDMRMPVMSGPEFARAYRARCADAAPIVVVTAAEDARRRAVEVGAQGWIGKPFEPDALLAEVRRVLDCG